MKRTLLRRRLSAFASAAALVALPLLRAQNEVVVDNAPEAPPADAPAADPFNVEPPAGEPAPAPAEPVVPAPVEPAPVEPAPVEPAPAEPAPAEAAPDATLSPDLQAEARAEDERQKVRIAAAEKEALAILDEAMGAYNAKQYGKALDAFELTLKNLRPREKNLRYVDLAREKGSDSAYQIAKGLYDARGEGKDPAEVRRYIEKSMELNPKNSDPRTLLALVEKWEEKERRTGGVPVQDTSEFLSKEKRIALLLKKGKEFLAVRDYDKAEEQFEQALSLDRYNREAMRLLAKNENERYEFSQEHHNFTIQNMRRQVEDTWSVPINPAGVGPLEQGTTTAIAKQESLIEKKMSELVIEDLSFTDAPIAEVFKVITQMSRELDTKDKTGINIVLLLSGPAAATPATPAPAADPFGADPFGADPFGAAPAAPAAAAAGGASPPINLSLRMVTIKDALRLICDIANLYYQIDGNVVLVTRSGDIRNVLTRFYPVDPVLMQSIQTITPPTPSNTFAPNAFDPAAAPTGGAGDLKEIFKGFGVPFPPGTDIRYEPAITQIIVSNTPENLEKFEAMLPKFNVQPRQVEIEARFVEVLQSDLRELGFEWIFTDDYEIASEKGNPLASRARIQADANPLGLTQGNRFFTFDPVNKSVSPNGRTTLGAGTASVTPLGNILSLSGVLTNPELQMVLHALDQRGSSDLLSAPRVTTLSGINAVIEVVREIIYPTEFDVSENDIEIQGGGGATGANVPFIPPTVIPGAFETREVGVILNVTPNVGPDNYTINLQLLPEIAELVDWIQYGTTIGLENGTSFVVNMPQPVFASRNVTTSMTVWDGHTVVMGGLIREDLVTINDKIPFLGDIPLLGRLFRNEGNKSDKRNLLIFVTARLVDPAGNPVNKPRGASTQTP
jgi:general secretion pathway protein D